MAKWGGVIGAALLGGITGAGQAAAAIGKQEADNQEFDRRAALEEAKMKRMELLRQAHADKMQADSQMFTASQNDLNREFQSGENEKSRGFQSGESEKTREFQSGENQKTRDQQVKLEGMREGSAERRHKETISSARGEDKIYQVLDKDGNVRAVKASELNDPANGYRPLSDAQTVSRATNAQMQAALRDIVSMRQAATAMPTKENRDKLRAAEAAFAQKYGQKPAGATSATDNGFTSVDDLINFSVGGK